MALPAISWSSLFPSHLIFLPHHHHHHHEGAGLYYFTALVLSFLVLGFFFKRSRNPNFAFPRGPPSWPILGHLPLLYAGFPHQTLAALSFRHGYGPIIGLRLGSVRAVVVSSASLAKEVLLTQDKFFANRPRYTFADTLYYGYDNGIGWSSYGPSWRRNYKICTLKLFTAKRLHDLQYVRQQEVAALLHRIVEASNGGTSAVDVGECVGEMTSNIMSRLLQSKTLSETSYAAIGGDSLPELVKELEQESAPTIGDFIPWLKCLDMLRKRRMQWVHKRFDKALDAILLERREIMRTTPPNELPKDFLQVLLSNEALDNEGLEKGILEGELLTTTDMKSILMEMLAAGVHTTALTIEWAMAELLRNPSCLRKLRDEMDTVLVDGGGELVTDEDIPKLPYLQSIVKEVFRLHPVAPMMIPRMTLEERKVEGKYRIPAGTQVYVNVWGIGRDPKEWEEAERFRPERFDEGEEKEKVDLRGQHYELLPFGSGRRICPGMRLGLAVVQVTLANLVRSLDWHLPPGQSPLSLDLSEKRGLTNNKATPVLAIPKLRRPHAFL